MEIKNKVLAGMAGELSKGLWSAYETVMVEAGDGLNENAPHADLYRSLLDNLAEAGDALRNASGALGDDTPAAADVAVGAFESAVVLFNWICGDVKHAMHGAEKLLSGRQDSGRSGGSADTYAENRVGWGG